VCGDDSDRPHLSALTERWSSLPSASRHATSPAKLERDTVSSRRVTSSASTFSECPTVYHVLSSCSYGRPASTMREHAEFICDCFCKGPTVFPRVSHSIEVSRVTHAFEFRGRQVAASSSRRPSTVRPDECRGSSTLDKGVRFPQSHASITALPRETRNRSVFLVEGLSLSQLSFRIWHRRQAKDVRACYRAPYKVIIALLSGNRQDSEVLPNLPQG